jgi:hypothetical protein
MGVLEGPAAAYVRRLSCTPEDQANKHISVNLEPIAVNVEPVSHHYQRHMKRFIDGEDDEKTKNGRSTKGWTSRLNKKAEC